MSAPDLEMGEKLLEAATNCDNFDAKLEAAEKLNDWLSLNADWLIATARRVAEMEGVLKEIDGEAPANEPRDGWTSTDPNDAYQEGWVRGMWTAAVIARKAITP